MSDEKMVDVKPIDLATVWGTAFGQLTDLWIAGLKLLLEGGNAESDITGDSSATVTVAAGKGSTPVLHAQDMKGESFGEKLDGKAVKFKPQEWKDGTVIIHCMVDEALAGPITGDIYRGTVVDAQGKPVAAIALDAGS